MSKNIFEKLNTGLAKLEDSYPYINMGGCGFTALYIGEEMEKRGYKVKYILIGDKMSHETSLEAFRQFRQLPDETKRKINEVNCNGFIIGHIMVYHKGLVLDPTGVRSWEHSSWNVDWKLITTTLTRDIIDGWLCQNGWNQSFDRDDLPEIKKKITKIFEKTFNK